MGLGALDPQEHRPAPVCDIIEAVPVLVVPAVTELIPGDSGYHFHRGHPVGHIR